MRRAAPGTPPPSLDAAEDHLAWIFGSSRSGSTWLLRMLSSLDAVVPIDDPHLGHHLGVWRPISLAWGAAEHPPDLTTLDRVKHDKDSYFFSDRYRDAWAPALRRLIVDRFDAQVRDTAEAAEPVVVVKEPGSHVADVLLSLFPGSRLGDGVEVRIRGVVQVNSWLDDGAIVPIHWIAVGTPAKILPPEKHDEIWAIQQPLDFAGTVYGVERGTPMEELMRQQSAWYQAHDDDVEA